MKLFSGFLASIKGMLRSVIHSKLKRRFRKLTVEAGPFQGLTYPGFEANCSAIFPKLLGSYEAELHAVMERWAGQSFPLILDVGCAEGYYAVGMAQRYPEAKVIAYDINADALQACRSLAELNEVSAQMEFREACTPAELLNLDFSQGGLIISDCEGYEEELFTPAVINKLIRCHLLIEVHDFLRPGLTERLQERFAKTHQVETISSLNDEAKVSQYQFPAMAQMNSLEKRYATAERRPEIMNWLIISPL